jgi:GNAT superfamily N-acetyltransferase
MRTAIEVAPIDGRKQEDAVRVLARAFRDNPLDLAVMGSGGGDRGARRRLRSVTHGMRAGLRSARAGGCTLLGAVLPEDSGPAGVLLAIQPGGFPLPPLPLLAHLRSVMGQGFRVAARWGEVYAAIEGLHPPEPHWYLSLLGVDPPRQGLGVGAGLLEHWLDSIDREGLPSYLETDREENVSFYGRAGFSVHVELQVLGAPVWCMRRPPR